MINNFGKGTILKGSDCELVITVSTCCHSVDMADVQNFSCAFYTESDGQAVMKHKEDFVFEGRYGIVHFQEQELDQLPDGVVRYTLKYDDTTLERNSSYYLKTPIGYTPMDFVSRDEVNEAIASAFTTSAVTEVINSVAQGLGFVNEEFVNSAITQAVSGLASEEYVEEAIQSSNLVHAVSNANKIWAGTRAAYSAQTIDNNTLYFITD